MKKYVIKHDEIPIIADVGGETGRDTLLMKKAIGWAPTDSKNVPEDWPWQLETLGLAWIKLWGRLRRIKCTGVDRVMYILKGECVIQVADAEPEYACAGDFVLIPQGSEYEFETDVLEYLVINSSVYRPGMDLRNDAIDGEPVRKGADEWTGTFPVPSWRRTKEGERELY